MGVSIPECPKCGSSEVREFKENKYICTHCESTFNYDPYSSTTRIVHDGTVKVETEREYCPICNELSGDFVFKCPECGRTGIHKHHRISFPYLYQGCNKKQAQYSSSPIYNGGVCEECASKLGFECDYCGKLDPDNKRCSK